MRKRYPPADCHINAHFCHQRYTDGYPYRNSDNGRDSLAYQRRAG